MSGLIYLCGSHKCKSLTIDQSRNFYRRNSYVANKCSKYKLVTIDWYWYQLNSSVIQNEMKKKIVKGLHDFFIDWIQLPQFSLRTKRTWKSFCQLMWSKLVYCFKTKLSRWWLRRCCCAFIVYLKYKKKLWFTKRRIQNCTFQSILLCFDTPAYSLTHLKPPLRF